MSRPLDEAPHGEQTSASTRHRSVLLKEVVEMLAPTEPTAAEPSHKVRILDCTLGGGGHAEALLATSSLVSLWGIDRDSAAVARVRERLSGFNERAQIIHGSFSDLQRLFSNGELGDGPFDRVLADLGTSMDQLKGERGFSFFDEGALDMRMDQSQPLSADQVVNRYEQRELVSVLKRGGCGNEAKNIARAIVAARPITSARHLAETIYAATPARLRGDTHPATVPFQAIRIEVNNELGQIEDLLEVLPNITRPDGGRCAIITFHSLEDTLVTRRMRRWEQGGERSSLSRVQSTERSRGKLLTKKAIVPTAEETQSNPPSRSARMRVFQFHSTTSIGESPICRQS